jgi:tRNA1Val (adenine37-N6)-methyltransferase
MLNAPSENKNVREFSSQVREGETVDEILGGKLNVIQKKRGYRFSVDALLLSHFVHLKKNELVLDMGTGSGVIAMIVACRWPCGKVIGVDIQEDLVDMARRSVSMNGLGDKVEIRIGDIETIGNLFEPQFFDVVIFNPPYRKLRSGRTNPDYQKFVARHEIKGSLRNFLEAAVRVLKTSGRVYIIYPASRIVDLLFHMRNSSIEPKRIRIVHSHVCSRGEFALVEGVKGGGEEAEVLSPLYIYAREGVYTEEMDRLFMELSEFC